MSELAKAEADAYVEKFMRGLIRRNPGQPEFHQAVRHVAENLAPFILEHPEYEKAQILERMTEPDRIITFRVTWQDDQGSIRVNRAWRVQVNNAIGPYKGGMRFHPSVTLSILQVSRFRAGLQEQPDRTADGRCQGWIEF